LASADVILETRALEKDYGGLKAVRGVDFALRRGEIRSIIGPNGAGKTTFFNLLAGKLPPTKGQILFKGRDVTGLPQHRICRLGVSKSHQITSIFPKLTVFENVRLAAQMRVTHYDMWSSCLSLRGVNEKALRLIERVGLTAKKDAVASVLPYGDQRYLEIAITLAADPEVILLDEPTAGMTPAETEASTRLIKSLAGQLTVVIVEHDMSVVMGISDRITTLHEGAVLAEGTPREIHDNPEVQRVYLGGHR
jgi:branched-chain amino acid transport system ATP-binding protein